MQNAWKLSRDAWVDRAVDVLVDFCKPMTRKAIHDSRRRDLQMAGHGRYKPLDLQPYLGYDNFAAWLMIVEWAWLKTLAKKQIMPKRDAKYLKSEILYDLIRSITTSDQDLEEAKTRHDIIALTNLMKQHYKSKKFPPQLHKWLHYCATSYDIISTAYALQYRLTFDRVILPKMRQVDTHWRELIATNVDTLQAGRTHLQTALPITVGFWAAQLHNRYVRNCRSAAHHANVVEGKFSGACGTSASQVVMMGDINAEECVLNMLGLAIAPISTQIAPPESLQSAYHALVQVSGTLANLGEDGRILQMSAIQELRSSSSTSSAMSHKTSNPIASEQLMGMHRTVVSQFNLLLMNMVSDLQRDLTGSSCMREYSGILVLVYQQLLTAERWLKNLKIDVERCRINLSAEERYLTAEVLHLALGMAGMPDAHHFVNESIIPITRSCGCSLSEAIEMYCNSPTNADKSECAEFLKKVPPDIMELLHQPELYIGKSKQIAMQELNNIL